MAATRWPPFRHRSRSVCRCPQGVLGFFDRFGASESRSNPKVKAARRGPFVGCEAEPGQAENPPRKENDGPRPRSARGGDAATPAHGLAGGPSTGPSCAADPLVTSLGNRHADPLRRSSAHSAQRAREALIERPYDQLQAQLQWLRDQAGIDDATIAGAILDRIGGRPIGSPFETTEQRSVIGCLALLWMWRGPTLDSVMFLSGPTKLEQIIQGEGNLDEALSIFRALERRSEPPGPMELRFQALLALDPALMGELCSMDELTSSGLILRLRARLRTPAGTQLVESMIERVSVRTRQGLVKQPTNPPSSSAAPFVESARELLGGAVVTSLRARVDPEQVELALEACDQALRLEPDNREALLLRAQAHILPGGSRDLPRARKDLDRVSQLDAGDGRVWRPLGEIHMIQGHPNVALHAYRRALAASTPDDEAYLFRAALRLELGELARAEADARAFLSVAPRSADGHALLGMVLRRRGEVTGAFEALEQSLELDPRHAAALVERALLYADLGHSERALADFDRAVLVSPEGAAYCNRGNLRLALGDREGAASDFTKALERNPEDVSARLNRGTLRLMLGDEEGAASDFEDAARRHPNSASARMKWGLLLLQQGRREEGQIELRAALALAPKEWAPRAQIEGLVGP